MLNYGINKTIELLSDSILDFQFVLPNTMSGNMFYNNYMVLHHDSLQSIVSLIKKYNMLDATKFFDKCNNLKAANFSSRNFDGLNAFLVEFKYNFINLAKQICRNIE